MISIIYKIYAFLFGRNFFIKGNVFLFQLSLRGLGILNHKGAYFTGEKKGLKKYLKDKKNPIVLDIGANVGNYSKYILESTNDASVIAFEPHPKTYQQLISNIEEIRFKAYNLGVGDQNGQLELYDYDTKDGSSHASLYKDVIKDLHKANPISHTVTITNLDNFLLEQNISTVDLLKIDTEGNELNVLLGCIEYLNNKKIKAIHFEFNEMNVISRSCFKNISRLT